jgi:hypothetical protein
MVLWYESNRTKELQGITENYRDNVQDTCKRHSRDKCSLAKQQTPWPTSFGGMLEKQFACFPDQQMMQAFQSDLPSVSALNSHTQQAQQNCELQHVHTCSDSAPYCVTP